MVRLEQFAEHEIWRSRRDKHKYCGLLVLYVTSNNPFKFTNYATVKIKTAASFEMWANLWQATLRYSQGEGNLHGNKLAGSLKCK